jgi:DNA-binding NarL/FixJ family response regulator
MSDIQLLLVDDHDVVRTGLRMLLEGRWLKNTIRISS